MVSLIRKSLAEARLLLAAGVLVVFVFTWIHVLVIAGIESGPLESLLDQFDWFEKFLPVSFAELVTYSGRVAIAFDHPIVLVCVLGFAISRGSDCISGELGRGTMEMLLSQPIHRRQIVLAHLIVTTLGLALLATAAWAGSAFGIHYAQIEVPAPAASIRIPILDWEFPNPWAEAATMKIPMSERVAATDIIPAAVNLFALGFCVSGIALLMSSWDRYRWRTIGLVIGIFVVQVLIKLLAMAVKSGWIMACTFLAGYEPQLFVKLAAEGEHPLSLVYWRSDGTWALGILGGNLLLVILGVACYLAATTIFCKRDLPAPL